MKYQLVVFLLAHSVCAIPLQDFFPFNGPNVCLYDTTTEMVHTSNVLDSNGVSIEELDRSQCDEFRLSPNDDGSSPNISIGFTFPFFAKRFKNVFVSRVPNVIIVKCNWYHNVCLMISLQQE